MKPSVAWPSKRIRFQLTSLMDLLLIIVFAQYLEYQDNKSVAEAQTKQAISKTQQALNQEHLQRSTELEQLRRQLTAEREEMRQQKDAAIVMAEEAKRRQALTEELLKGLLNIDPNMLDDKLSTEESKQVMRDAQETGATIRGADPTKLLRFLAGYDELLKRAEVWTVHVSDRGFTELQPGLNSSQRQSFRLEARTQESRTREFVQQMRAAYSQIEQPKGLVVILVSFSPRAIAGNYQPVVDGMPQVIESLSSDVEGRTRFEYTVIGAITDPARDLPFQLQP